MSDLYDPVTGAALPKPKPHTSKLHTSKPDLGGVEPGGGSYARSNVAAWAASAEAAHPEDSGPLRSEVLAKRKGWWSMQRFAEHSRRLLAWSRAKNLFVQWLVVGGLVPLLWLGWFMLFVTIVVYGFAIMIVVWPFRAAARRRRVEEARHRETLDALRSRPVQP